MPEYYVVTRRRTVVEETWRVVSADDLEVEQLEDICLHGQTEDGVEAGITHSESSDDGHDPTDAELVEVVNETTGDVLVD